MGIEQLRRLDKFRLMSVRELSPWLVHASYSGKFLSPSKRYFEFYDDALDDCEKWLNEFGEVIDEYIENKQ